MAIVGGETWERADGEVVCIEYVFATELLSLLRDERAATAEVERCRAWWLHRREYQRMTCRWVTLSRLENQARMSCWDI